MKHAFCHFLINIPLIFHRKYFLVNQAPLLRVEHGTKYTVRDAGWVTQTHIRIVAKRSIDRDNKTYDIAADTIRLGGDPFDTKFIDRCLLKQKTVYKPWQEAVSTDRLNYNIFRSSLKHLSFFSLKFRVRRSYKLRSIYFSRRKILS